LTFCLKWVFVIFKIAEKTFNAHCLDSFIIASKDFDKSLLDINKETLFVEKIVKQRRALTRIRAKYKDSSKYFRYAVGGEKVFFTNISRKKNICRVKIDVEHSNHPKQWVYLDNGFAEKIKSNTARYGGTSFNGEQKFFQNNEWLNRALQMC
jgi:hypothetical protein